MKKILLIEDDTALIEIYRARLAQEGYEVSVAIDGETGIDLAATLQPDLIITGILISNINGLDILQLLKQTPETVAIPVLVLSVLFKADTIKQARELGAIDYMFKSRETMDDTVQVVSQILAGNYTTFSWADAHAEHHK